jgi:hypothetical protein
LAYLLADRPGILRIWDSERRTIRKRFLRDERRIAFKGLADRNKQKTLGPFLESASSINGILFCVAIEKSIALMSSFRLPSGDDIAKWSSLPWKPRVLEKLIRVSLFGSFLVGGLCRQGQNLHWITDEDEIVPNEDYQKDAAQIMGGMLHQYCTEKMGQISLGIAGKFEDDRRAEDLISIVDLAGGAFSERLTALGTDRLPKSTNIFAPMRKPMSTKSQLILSWMFESKRPLKKVICLLRPSEDGKVLVSFARPGMRTRFPGENLPLWLPPDKGWIQSAESW